MVKPFKMGNRKNYYFQIMINGKRIIESTGENNYNSALKKAKERDRELKSTGSYTIHLKRLLDSINSLPIKGKDAIISECAKLLIAGTLHKMRIEDAYNAFIEKPRSVAGSKSTMNSYKRVWNNFIKWINEKYPEKEYMNEITEIIAEEYATNVWKTGVAEQTYNENIKNLRSMFNALEKSAGLTSNVWKSVKKVKVNSVSKQPLTNEQFVKLMEEAKGEIKQLFYIGFYTGLRLGDACLLKWREIDLKRNVIRKMPNKTKGTEKYVEIPIHSDLMKILNIRSNMINTSQGEYILPISAVSYLKDPGSISRKVQRVFVKAGIKTTEERSRGLKDATIFGFHSLRHSFISLCAAEGIPQHVVREMVGHSSEAIHQIYQHASIDQKRKAIDSFPKIEE